MPPVVGLLLGMDLRAHCGVDLGVRVTSFRAWFLDSERLLS